MAVRIVTDSIADLPSRIVEELGIKVVPLIIGFEGKEYRDGVDLAAVELYERLKTSLAVPRTSVPPPSAFLQAFEELAGETSEILVITLASRLSGTYEAARQSSAAFRDRVRIEVLDSQTATMAEGFVVMKAAGAARAGASLAEAMQVAREAIPRTALLATFDTLKYLQRGGRIGAAKVFLGSLLKINPLITLQDGLVAPAGRTRSRAKAISALREFVEGFTSIEELAVGHGACPADAEALIEQLGAVFPEERIYRSNTTPVIGAHTGPGLLVVSVIGDRKEN
jgi:DegV family protein with EDD domain